MLTEEQTRLIKDIKDNQKRYISLIKDRYDREDAYDLYSQFNAIFGRYYANLQNEISSRIMYDQALRSHKIDPFIAGGAAQGLAGLGAGIYAASSTAGRNAQIDADRNKYQNQVRTNSFVTSSSESELLKITKTLDEFLNTIEEIQLYRKK